MTNPWLAEFDAIARDAFADVELADRVAATYTPAGSSTPIPCTLLIDRGVIPVGLESVVTSPQIVITAYRDQIGADDPQHGAQFAIGAETFFVDAISRSDESAVACIVVPG